jgi:Tfp pilus assembly protein PilF
MFLGTAYERSGATENARLAYQRAQVLFPNAQSAPLALSQLERRADNYEAAKDAVERIWSRAESADAADDPWWGYSVSHAADADTRVEAVWRSIE